MIFFRFNDSEILGDTREPAVGSTRPARCQPAGPGVCPPNPTLHEGGLPHGDAWARLPKPGRRGAKACAQRDPCAVPRFPASPTLDLLSARSGQHDSAGPFWRSWQGGRCWLLRSSCRSRGGAQEERTQNAPGQESRLLKEALRKRRRVWLCHFQWP